MKKIAVVMLALALVSCVSDETPTSSQESALSNVTARITCLHGQTSSTSGVYGGVNFSVGCRSGKTGSTTIVNPADATWSMRVGVETTSGAFDCAFDSTTWTLPVSCVGTVVQIN